MESSLFELSKLLDLEYAQSCKGTSRKTGLRYSLRLWNRKERGLLCLRSIEQDWRHACLIPRKSNCAFFTDAGAGFTVSTEGYFLQLAGFCIFTLPVMYPFLHPRFPSQSLHTGCRQHNCLKFNHSSWQIVLPLGIMGRILPWLLPNAVTALLATYFLQWVGKGNYDGTVVAR